MTPFEYLVGSLIVGLYINGFVYYKLAVKEAVKVKAELMILRENDLKHINEMLSQITDHIFRLAKKD